MEYSKLKELINCQNDRANEYLMICQLRHLDCWQEDNTFHLVTELCSQGNIENFIGTLVERNVTLNVNFFADLIFQLIYVSS